MQQFLETKNYKNIIFWSIVVVLLYTSYEWLGDIIVSAFGVLDLKFNIINEALASSLSAFMDTIMSLALSIIYLILAIFIVKKKPGTLKISLPLTVVFCVIMGFGFNGITGLWFNFVDNVLVKIPAVAENVNYFSGVYDDLESGAYIWSLLSISIIGPISEEILFRLLIFNSLERLYSKPWFPIIVSGVLFGIWHMIFVQSVYTAIMGCLFGFIYYKTRNLFITILIHMVNNFIGNLPPALNTDAVYNLLAMVANIMVLPTVVILILMYTNKSGNALEAWKE